MQQQHEKARFASWEKVCFAKEMKGASGERDSEMQKMKKGTWEMGERQQHQLGDSVIRDDCLSYCNDDDDDVLTVKEYYD